MNLRRGEARQSLLLLKIRSTWVTHKIRPFGLVRNLALKLNEIEERGQV